MADSKKKEFHDLVQVMARLRAPGGCPWDREQTLKSLLPYIIEEAYEVVEAIESEDHMEIKEEIGDLLLQVIFIAQIEDEDGRFDIYDAIRTAREKMVRRHPHVFGDATAETSSKVLDQWVEIKKEEKREKAALASVPNSTSSSEGILQGRGGETPEGLSPGEEEISIFEGIPKKFPSLLKAHKVSKRASRAGFDFSDIEGPLSKITEELSELKEALRSGSEDEVESEVGDLLFAIVNVARFAEVNPEIALMRTIERFIKRFNFVEGELAREGRPLNSAGLEELEALWERAKSDGRG